MEEEEFRVALAFGGHNPSSEASLLASKLARAGFETSFVPLGSIGRSLPGSPDAMVVCLDETPSGEEALALWRLTIPFVFALMSRGAAVPPELASHPTFDFKNGVPQVEVLRLIRALEREAEPEIPVRTSASLGQLLDSVTDDVSASELARELAKKHPDYIGGRAGSLEFGDEPLAKRQQMLAWLEEIRPLYDPSIRNLSTRRVLFGLGLLEPSLREALEEQDHAFATLTRELDPPPELALSEAGHQHWQAQMPAEVTEQSVPIHTDNPATVDALQREGLARVLAKRIRDMRSLEESTARRLKDEDFPRGRSFLVHLDGPWGAGKTSLLNFLTRELEPGKRIPWIPFARRPAAGEAHWLVVQFNAWQHQRIVPPWWWLMSALSRQGGRLLWRIDVPRAVFFRIREWIWRAWIGWPWYLLAAAAGGVIAVLAA